MNQEDFTTLVMARLPELDQEEKELPGIIADIQRMYSEGWNIPDAIRYCRLNESVNCWTQEDDGTWRHRIEEEMLPEDVCIALMSKINKKYSKGENHSP